MFLKSNERSFVNGKNHINGIENFFSKRVRRIGSKQSVANVAKHKSCDLCCYYLLKGYECSEVEFRYNTKTYTGKLISETVEIDKRSYR